MPRPSSPRFLVLLQCYRYGPRDEEIPTRRELLATAETLPWAQHLCERFACDSDGFDDGLRLVDTCPPAPRLEDKSDDLPF